MKKIINGRKYDTETAREVAEAADRMVRERLGDAYEVIYDEAEEAYVVAAPRDESEGGRADQPTAVTVGYAEDFDDAEGLYEAARSMTDRVDELAARLAERDY